MMIYLLIKWSTFCINCLKMACPRSPSAHLSLSLSHCSDSIAASKPAVKTALRTCFYRLCVRVCVLVCVSRLMSFDATSTSCCCNNSNSAAAASLMWHLWKWTRPNSRVPKAKDVSWVTPPLPSPTGKLAFSPVSNLSLSPLLAQLCFILLSPSLPLPLKVQIMLHMGIEIGIWRGAAWRGASLS